MLALATGLYNANRLERNLAFYQPQAVEPQSITLENWLEQDWETVPAYRDDLEGRHLYPLDIQWLANLENIRTQLQAQGWVSPRRLNLSGTLDMFRSDADANRLPVLPQLHRGEPQDLLLVRQRQQVPHLLVLRLWSTEYQVNGHTLWTGNVSHLDVDRHFRLFSYLRTAPDFDAAQLQFEADIAEPGTWRVQSRQLPAGPGGNIWSGKVLLIYGD